MKALIVDDEKHVRDAIRMLVDWSEFRIDEILEAPDGESAIRIMEAEKPEIVFTDMRMPIKNGVELLEWIHRNAPSSKTIVVSGHDDFDFVRHTVRYGGMDYILKPIDADELNEALAKAVDRWNRENEARRKDQIRAMEINQAKPAYWDKWFSNLIEGVSVPASLPAHLCRDFGLHAMPEQARVAILSVDTMPQVVRKKFEHHQDLLFFSLANIANEYLRRDKGGYAFRCWNSPNELVLVCWHSPDSLEERILDINEGMRQALGGKLDAGIGTAKRFPADLPEAYKEAKLALKQRNLLKKAGRILAYDPERIPRLVPLPFSQFEAELRTALVARQDMQIREAVSRWIDAFRPLDSITVEQLELWNHEYAVFKTRCLSELIPDGKTGSPSKEKERSAPLVPLDDNGAFSLPLLKELVLRDLLRLSSFLARLAQREHNIIYDIVDYIERHYHEDISLQHIADRFFMSREYISRRFKQELGENISDCITRTRMEKAKRFLQNRELRIAQIAEMTGYQDEKYFSKVFKKNVGLSPTDYRRKLPM